MPANEASTVDCPADAVAPTTPTVNDACGPITPTLVSTDPDPACEGDIVWTYNYADCAGNNHNWTYTYTIDIPELHNTPANEASTVDCPADAVAPTTPTVNDACGNLITPTWFEQTLTRLVKEILFGHTTMPIAQA